MGIQTIAMVGMLCAAVALLLILVGQVFAGALAVFVTLVMCGLTFYVDWKTPKVTK